MGALNAIFLSIIYYTKKSRAMLILGAVISSICILGIIYAGSIVIKDETSGAVRGTSSLPKTSFGPLSMYHVEYAFVFLLIVGFALLMWGYVNLNE
jgi:hypothetical protein